MKSLSILVLLGTLSALVLGAIFAVTPVLARSASPSIETSLTAAQSVSPITGNAADTALVAAPATDLNAENPDLVNTVTSNLEKDTASAQAAQEAQAKAEAAAAEKQTSFDNFVQSVSNGNANQVTGIYAEDALAYKVVRQPKGNAAFVSSNPDEVTQFGMAAEYGSLAFLGHNYLAGASFSALTEGQIITLVYGDGSSQQFLIQNIKRYQALSPDSTQSNFVDLESGEKLSNSDLFHSVYNSDHSVVLQTCIAKDGVSTWGRLFVIAVPLS